jgi:hypothetical protein
MGRLIKNHWGRLIILTAAACMLPAQHCQLEAGADRIQTDQVASAVEGFIWPKVFWDFISRNLDAAVAPVPVLQILNLIMGLVGIAWEWPLKPLAGSIPHRSIEIRLIIYPLSALLAALLYQGTDPAIYYLIGIGVYFWAYTEGEVCSSAYLTGCSCANEKMYRSSARSLGPCRNGKEYLKHNNTLVWCVGYSRRRSCK